MEKLPIQIPAPPSIVGSIYLSIWQWSLLFFFTRADRTKSVGETILSQSIHLIINSLPCLLISLSSLNICIAINTKGREKIFTSQICS